MFNCVVDKHVATLLSRKIAADWLVCEKILNPFWPVYGCTVLLAGILWLFAVVVVVVVIGTFTYF